jgi:hypothetical protein
MVHLRYNLYLSFGCQIKPRVYGRLTEWLGSGLQNRLRRFESATDLNLNNKPAEYQRVLFFRGAYLAADFRFINYLKNNKNNNFIPQFDFNSFCISY